MSEDNITYTEGVTWQRDKNETPRIFYASEKLALHHALHDVNIYKSHYM